MGNFLHSLSSDTYVNIMEQYRPNFKVGTGEQRARGGFTKYEEIDRPVQDNEMEELRAHALKPVSGESRTTFGLKNQPNTSYSTNTKDRSTMEILLAVKLLVLRMSSALCLETNI